MTTNVNNQGIAHLAFRVGGTPLCKKRGAFVTVTDGNHMGYRICKRCEAKMAKMKERAAAVKTFAGHVLYDTHDECVAAAKTALGATMKEGPDFITTDLAPCTKPGRELPGGWIWESFAAAAERVRKAG